MAYVLTAITYSITEAGFRMLSPNWIFLLLAVLEASRIAAGGGATGTSLLKVAPNKAPELPANSATAMRPTGRAMIGKS